MTNFFCNFKILISRKFEIFIKTSHLKLVGTPCTTISQAEEGKRKKMFNQTCDHCQKVFKNYKTYLSHCWSHSPEKWKISCQECPKLFFQTKRHLMIHQSKIHGQHKKCPHCSKMLSTDANLREHIRNLHSTDR